MDKQQARRLNSEQHGEDGGSTIAAEAIYQLRS